MDAAKITSNRIPQNLSVKIDHIFVVLIVLSGFLVYFHHLFPEVKVWKTLFFQFAPDGMYSAQTFFYVLFIKITPVVLLSLWFLSDDHWWCWGILFPLGNLLFQLMSFLNETLHWFSGDRHFKFFMGVFLCLTALILVRRVLQYHQRNFGLAHHIGSENLHIIPDNRRQNKRISRVKDLLGNGQLDRTSLNLVYREYDYLQRLSAELSETNDFSASALNFIGNNFQFKRFLEVVVCSCLMSMPFVFNLHEIVEEGALKYELLGFTIREYGFFDVRTMLWVLCTKLVVVTPLTLWFFTSRYWWKYFLLIPFVVYAVQIIEMFKPVEAIDGSEFFLILPVIIAVLLVMTVVSLRIRRYLDLKDFYQVMESKINETVSALAESRDGGAKQRLQDELAKLMREHKKYSPEEYLKALKGIKRRLEHIGED